MKKRDDNIILIVLLILLILIVFVISFGTFNPLSYKSEEENQSKRENESLLSRYNRLVVIIEKQKALKRKLDKIFRWTYLSFRIILVTTYLSLNYISYNCWGFDTLDKLLSLNEMSLIIIGLILFIIYRDIKSMTDAISQIKKYIKYLIYKKYDNIDERIVLKELEKNKIGNQIKKI